MDARELTDDPRIAPVIAELQQAFDDGRIVSDVIDSNGHQYVDLVIEGGGVLGVALAGYTWALRRCGIRFHSIAGASAGAINAMLLAALDGTTPTDPQDGTEDQQTNDPVSPQRAIDDDWLIDKLANVPIDEFVDGPAPIRKFIKSWFWTDRWRRFFRIGFWMLNVGRVWRQLCESFGLNPGKRFEQWLTRTLDEAGLSSLPTLDTRRERVHGRVRMRDGILAADGTPRSVDDLDAKLIVVSADLVTQSRVVLPQRTEHHWSTDPHPAALVRASMSIPGFFEPVVLEAGGRVDRPSMMIDGGLLSNFPIDLLHRPDLVPRLPTFGVKVGVEPERTKAPEAIGGYLTALLLTLRRNLEHEHILANPDFERIVQAIDTQGHSWLEFDVEDAAKLDLFARGVESAADFLLGPKGADGQRRSAEGFDWASYKELRGVRASMFGG
ncbi:MAG: patatin-like phospholipase family protein [Acidobacteriota bacterium]